MTPPEQHPWISALTREERRELMQIEDWRGWLSLLGNWAIVAAAFTLVAWAPSIWTVIVAIFVIGARQLGFAVIMHEAAHHALLGDPRLNDTIANWLAAYPVWSDVHPYRAYHLVHHAKNWTDKDPDRGLAEPFPATAASMRRKVWRDLSGQTGWKRAKATLKRDLGQSRGKVKRTEGGITALRGVIITNGILFAILAAVGHPALYLLWVVSWLTTFSLVMRIRSIAEHAMIEDPADPLKNTRTTIANLAERLLIAPNRVNYHLEHHLYMGMPLYNLPKLHMMLRERGVLDDACVETGYVKILKMAGSASGGGGDHTDTDQSLTWG
jgi:fatty acid desaturase